MANEVNGGGLKIEIFIEMDSSVHRSTAYYFRDRRCNRRNPLTTDRRWDYVAVPPPLEGFGI